ncbi:MAG: hypothetical protein J5U17_07020 [Candidatus Methanoperedens sp.]|nr:hypothetical protein [Candidatus Methanoperedens sp.]
MSEDALFKALLKNKPVTSAPRPQAPVRKEPVKPVLQAPPAPPVETHDIERPAPEVRITKDMNPVQTELILESIKNLNASVNAINGVIKSMILPVMILILIGIAILLIK